MAVEPADSDLGADARYLVGTLADSAGVIRGKQVSRPRAGVYATAGLGASPSWVVFCVDDEVAFTPHFGVVGDMRLRADLSAAADLGEGMAWAPLDLIDQDGQELPVCYRGALRRQVAAVAELGLTIRSAIEIECVLFDETGQHVAGAGGPAYGAQPLLAHSQFVDDVFVAFDRARLPVEQLHAEYGPGQFELSIGPSDPLAAADANHLARLLLSQCARRHGMRVSFSPHPIYGSVGSGAHVHLSLYRDGVPLLSGGDGPADLSADGAAAVAGLVASLPDAIGALAPSLLSPLRLQPHHWAGAFACWGVENREAAVRVCRATAGNPHGANVEVKPVDASANPYVVLATLVGLCLDGMRRRLTLPPPVDSDPASVTGLAAEPIGRDQETGIDRLEASQLMQSILGAPLVEALVAVRRHELEIAKNDDIEALVEKFRFAWSS